MSAARRAVAKKALAAGLLLGVVASAALAAGLFAAREATSPPTTALEQLGDYGLVPRFALIERSGQRVTSEDLHGHIWVADFIYTECTESCPTQSLQFAQLQREFAGVLELRLVSMTVDPLHDTPEVLRRYADRYGASERWWFLTGDKHDIYCLAHDGFRLSVADPREGTPVQCGRTSWLAPPAAWASHGSGGFVMHSARVVLVDRAAHIRAYHLATEPESMRSLRVNLRRLLAEAGPGLRR